MPSPTDVVTFWTNAGPGKWFAKDSGFDQTIRENFEALHMAAARGECADWALTAGGALALMILLDQVPRNMYRGTAHAFATDPLARKLAGAALDAGHDKAVDRRLRVFFYMPFEHSEDLADQERCVALFEALALEVGAPGDLRWSKAHHEIIARFGRFPHRNAALGRETTSEEAEFLAKGGFAG